jgi:hypothetical protein
MTLEATARELAEAKRLLPDVLATALLSDDEVEVRSASGASVVLARRDDMAVEGVFDHWEVFERAPSDAPRRPRGFGRAAGSWLDLTSAAEFATFFKQAGRKTPPDLLARLVTRYQGHEQGIDLPQNTLVTLADLRGALEPEVAASLDGFTELRHETHPDESGKMAFCSFYIARDEFDGVFRVGVNRWDVSWNRAGEVTVRVRPIARGLDSPRYRPRR